MGLTVEYFYSLTPREFGNALEGFRNREQRAMRESWEQTRMLMWAALSPYKGKGQTLTPQSLLPFDWDKPEQLAYTPEQEAEMMAEVEAMQKRWEERDAKRAARNLNT